LPLDASEDEEEAPPRIQITAEESWGFRIDSVFFLLMVVAKGGLLLVDVGERANVVLVFGVLDRTATMELRQRNQLKSVHLVALNF
jgi:hypothetical protein